MWIQKAAKILVVTALALTSNSMYAIGQEAKRKSSKHIEHVHSLKSVLASFLPRENIEIRQIRNSVILAGTVTSTEAADKAEKIAKEYVGDHVKIMNFMKIKTSQQVMLRVKIGEVVHHNLHNLNPVNASFSDLEENGVIKVVAEPNLVAISGERAEFLSGGEFPVPAANKDGVVSIDYKTYGVQLTFTPVVISPNRIRLNVEQETSDINKEKSVVVSGIKVPAITSKRAKTTIELAPGESFMIAGLVKEDMHNNRKRGSELVISVTPYLVDPVPSKNISIPGDTYIQSPLERKFVEKVNSKTQKIQAKGKTTGGAELKGPIGFIAE